MNLLIYQQTLKIMKIRNIFSYAKERKNDIYYVLKSNDIEEEELFTTFDITNATKFEKKFKSNDGESFYLELSTEDDKKIIEPFLKIFESEEIANRINKKKYDFENINNIFYQVDNKIKIQKVYCKYYFRKKILCTDKGIETNKDIIVLQKEIDAIFDKNTNKLYFKDFRKIKTIIPGMDKFYREATDEDCDKFLNSSILVSIDFKKNNINNSIRQKIAIMLDEKQLEDSNIINKIQNCINVCKEKDANFISPEIQNNKIIIKNNKDIKILYKLLNGCYYTNMINEELMETNSQKKYSGN